MTKPIVKWAGGKTRLVDALLAHLPMDIGTYVEPFAGGAALFFGLADTVLAGTRRLRKAVLADHNPELMACYRAVKTDVEGVVQALGRYRYDRQLYYEVRRQRTDTMSDVERGARLLFLNRTCFNGLWRVNARGEFNVPFGSYKNPSLVRADNLRAAARALALADLKTGDFTKVTARLKAGDVVYFDPPYVPASPTANFTSYVQGGFGPADQARLAAEAKRLRDAGVCVVLSNADTPEARALYDGFTTRSVPMPRAISAHPRGRGSAPELLVLSAQPARPRRASR